MIEIIPIAAAAADVDMFGATAIVIDVLRATTVMTAAIANGAREIIPVRSIDDALTEHSKLPSALLGGERKARRISGFDLGNSPQEYTREKVEGKTIIMTTTNGTRAIANSMAAQRILVASMLNLNATIDAAASADRVFIVCAGTEGKFSIEDALCAGLIAKGLLQHHEHSLTDFAWAMLNLAEASTNMQQTASKGSHYQRLIKEGFGHDIDYCFQRQNLDALVCKAGIVRKYQPANA